ncbi:TetR/AcrR family transcriptional regulator C-terminal ligand-binding domain-containing protein [Streptomyces sp. DW26H14]|uniref:TetR/AcrR family transcriptional regulator C-terminal ligand-binding domain-containing protein n=1 Tax=Streptomyces sp. DW26H14 TaxID=3435395 RepID=UPI00403E343F
MAVSEASARDDQTDMTDVADIANAMDGGPCPRRRRSRLSAERESEIYTGVLALLREGGYEALTMDAVALNTRCSKATLYRKWSGKPQLVAASLRHNRPFDFEGLDTGTLAGDLYELATRMGQAKKDTDLLRAVAPAVTKDPDLAAAFGEVLKQDHQALYSMFDRAAERGEVAPDCPARAFLPHLLLGAVVARSLIDQKEPDPIYLRRYVDAVVLPALTRR